ncbi:efflux transporter outer membrane subunit [Rhodanobacter sp. DHB23]|uniref:efflux transporter outer membrane subunit n=1 Tax=Rhodanobacter sp. DHB23 TaxID=2775923 RepID=UPI001CE0938E|nr:efflux transporter outer membrane subunit [Rhodanobacter sp. DHB23]
MKQDKTNAALTHGARHGMVLLATVMFTGCASTAGLHTQATMRDVNQVQATRSLSGTSLSVAAWPQDEWWTEYGDPQLDRLMDNALNGQPGLRIAEARVRQAQAVAGVVAAGLYPQANASIKSTRQRFSEDGTVPPPIAGTWQTINDLSLGVGYELDFWGKNHAAVSAAIDRVHATEVDLQAARLMLATALTRVYLRLDLAYAQLDLAQATLKQREQTLALTRRRVAAQIDSQLELTQAEAALPVARERIAAINESIALIANQLAALQGKGPDAGLQIARPQLAGMGAVSLPGNLPAELVGRRPDVVADRWRVEAASQDIKVARAQFYPNISLNSLVGLQSLGFDNFLDAGSRVIGIGPAISLPIFDGGRLRGNLGARQAGYDAAVEHYNATVIAAVHDVVDQLVSLHWLEQQEHEQNEALRLTQRAYDLALARYRSGLANYLQVLSAEAQVLAQKRLVIDSQSRQRELRLNLIRALGGGYSPAVVPDAAAATHAHIRGSKS